MNFGLVVVICWCKKISGMFGRMIAQSSVVFLGRTRWFSCSCTWQHPSTLYKLGLLPWWLLLDLHRLLVSLAPPGAAINCFVRFAIFFLREVACSENPTLPRPPIPSHHEGSYTARFEASKFQTFHDTYPSNARVRRLNAGAMEGSPDHNRGHNSGCSTITIPHHPAIQIASPPQNHGSL